MIKNIGKIDKILRFILGAFLLWLGLFLFDGKGGNIWGILVALTSLLPFYMVISGSCFVFNWFKIHSLSKSELQDKGEPYPKN